MPIYDTNLSLPPDQTPQEGQSYSNLGRRDNPQKLRARRVRKRGLSKQDRKSQLRQVYRR